jgi:uncharacterized membrane protein
MARVLNGGSFSRGWWILATVLSAGVAIFSYRYLPRIGPMPAGVLGNLFHRPWLDVHVAGAATALLVGPVQFLPRLRTRRRDLHRLLGRIYVAGCLAGGVGGLVLAFGTTAGPIAGVGFGSLAVVWLTSTSQAWRMALARRFDEHRAWMIRSFALTFGAVTLRLYLPILPLFGLSFIDSYRLTSFLAWIPNLILAELYLRGAFARRPRTAPAETGGALPIS